MKVIVSDTPLIVEDQNGNVLFKWYPTPQVGFLHKSEKVLNEKEINQLLKERN